MAHRPWYAWTQQTNSYVVHLNPSHIVEVRKQGTEVGIYKITHTGKKRGILLPTDVWDSLVKFRNLINVAVDLSVGSITKDNVTETFLQNPLSLYTHDQKDDIATVLPCINYQHTNNGSRQPLTATATTTTAAAARHTGCETSVEQQSARTQLQQQQKALLSTATATTIAPTTQNVNTNNNIFYQTDVCGETIPLLEFFQLNTQQQRPSPEFQSITHEEDETCYNVNTYGTAHLC